MIFYVKKRLWRVSLALLCFFCLKAKAQTFTFDFETDAQGWLADWADYPVSDSIFYQLESKHTALPRYILPNQKGIYIKGFNHSDDLFMFLKKKLTNLLSNQKYKIQFQIELASNAPTNAIGVGGSPGLYLKAGATSIEPIKIKQSDAGTIYYRMNIDKGNQSMPGAQMDTIGKTGVSDTTTQFALINRQNKNAFFATTNANGELWAIVGTESGFESLSELYYSHIVLTLSVVTKTDDGASLHTIKVYPNPSSSVIFIENYADFDHFEIYDYIGRLLKNAPLSKNEIDVSFLAGGQYILRLMNKSHTVKYAKFIKAF